MFVYSLKKKTATPSKNGRDRNTRPEYKFRKGFEEMTKNTSLAKFM